MNHEAARNMAWGKGFVGVSRSERRGGEGGWSPHRILLIPAPFAPTPRRDRAALAMTGVGVVSRGGMGSQSETQLAGAAGISGKSQPRPAARLSDFFPTGKHLCTYNPPSLGLIFSGTLCSDFARRKLERGKGDKDVETEPGLSLQNLSPTPSSSDAYAEGNL